MGNNDWLTDIAHVFFNGKHPSEAAKPRDSKVTIGELVRRKSSVIFYDGKLYNVTVSEAVIERTGR